MGKAGAEKRLEMPGHKAERYKEKAEAVIGKFIDAQKALGHGSLPSEFELKKRWETFVDGKIKEMESNTQKPIDSQKIALYRETMLDAFAIVMHRTTKSTARL